MKICGDWIFYLNLIHGGKIAYCQETNNYFRFHDDNSSAKTHQSDIYYEEHEQVASCLASLYRVPNDILKRNFQIIRNFYYQHIENATDEKLSSLYNIEKVLATKQNRLPNILMVIYAFSTGGAEIGSIRLANELKEKGVAITTLIGNFMPRNPGVRNMLDPQVPVINYAQNTDLSLLVREFGIEVIHTNHASLEYLIANFASKEGDKFIHVATMHGMYEMMSNFEIDAKRYIDRIDHWFYIADKNLIPFKKYGYYLEDKFTKVNNGMRFDQMNPIDRKELGITGDSFVVCLASRAFAEKGWREAIKAISAAREITKKEIHLLLLGEGIVYEELVLDQLPDYIHLMGNKYNVIDYFGGSDVGLLPSYFLGESVPLAIIECLAAGKPVIASDIGEIPNMITDANNNMAGIIVKLEKGSLVIDDLTSAIVRMATDQEFYNRCANSAKEVREKFSISPVTDVYISCYKKLAFSNISSSK
jgi:glycosyltransferase involved in cell wall biosynthesis